MPLLLMKEVSKIYPGTIALDKASIKLEKGQVLGMLGLNGAGKSTLKAVVSGYRRKRGALDGVSWV